MPPVHQHPFRSLRSLAAQCALTALGLGGDDWRTPTVLPDPDPLGRRVVRNARWTREHLAPWLLRRVRGESSGDAVLPKHPGWVRVAGVASTQQAN